MIPSLKSMQHRLRMKQLLLICALDEFRSLRKVAEAMHQSQPAATKMLQEIEETLGVPLFERLPRGIRPTEFGQSVINYAQLMLADLDNLRKQLVAQQAGAVGEVSVGSIMGTAPGLLTRTIIELRARYPLIKISIHVETSDVLMQMLEHGKLDIVLGRIQNPAEHADLNFEAVDNEELSVVAGVHHPLSQVPGLELGDLAGQSWILQPPTSPMRQLLELEFQEASMPSPSNLIETASILTTTTLLQGTEMISVVPTTVARHYATSGMICILSVRIKRQLEPYGIITRKERIPAPAVSVFQDCLRSVAAPDRQEGSECRQSGGQDGLRG